MEMHEQLESEWAKFCVYGTGKLTPQQCVACNSGTAALHLAVECLDIPRMAGVIVPEYTMVAVPRAVTLAGCTPIAVDVDPDTYLLDLDKVEEKLENYGRQIFAIIAVDTFGRAVDRHRLLKIKNKYGVHVIEDMAEAHGLTICKDFDAWCWSFYKNKIIHGEEGGMVSFNSPKRAAVARELRCLGMTEKHDFIHRPRGHNYRLAPSLAFKVICSMTTYESELTRRWQLHALYAQRMHAGFSTSEWSAAPYSKTIVPWVFDIRFPGLREGALQQIVFTLNEQGIEARCGFRAVSEQPEWNGAAQAYREGLVAWRLGREVLYLPLSQDVSADDAVFAVERLRKAWEAAS